MRICPLNLDECTKIILPLPKTSFLMTPSEQKTTPELKKIINEIKKILDKYSFKSIEGSKIVDYGDFLCSICKNILGCSFGIAISSLDIPQPTLCNIFWEKGLMEGFGKPVILFVDDEKNLPSDFTRTFSVFLNHKDPMSKFEKLLKKFIEMQDFYSNFLGDRALEVGDYEKAGRYYQEAYLLGKDPANMKKIENLFKILKEIPDDYKGLKSRLQDNLSIFLQTSAS